ncbi:MAG: hypothetical protein IAE78_32960 [Myxococcus sp.]|nr:hypothetical protein [Myxococcus sp.]
MRPGLMVGLVGLLGACSFDLAAVRAELTPRAANDLGCKANKLDFEEIKAPLAPSNVRVTGCGKKNEYSLVEGRWTPVRRSQQSN